MSTTPSTTTAGPLPTGEFGEYEDPDFLPPLGSWSPINLAALVTADVPIQDQGPGWSQSALPALKGQGHEI